MLLVEHIRRIIEDHDVTARIVERDTCTERASYVAWTPTREGPPRLDYAAANADLQDMLRA